MSSETVREDVPSVASLLVSASSVEPSHKGEPLKHIDMFAGLGGFSLGLERSGGFETIAVSEIDPFACAVLRKNLPDVPNLGDVTTAEFPNADVITAGFPCQDLSWLGHGAGLAGHRSSLFQEALRAHCMVGSKYLLLENVAALLRRGMGTVLGALASEGNDAEWDSIQAADVGAPHFRNRVWIVAYPDSEHGRSREIEIFAHVQDGLEAGNGPGWPAEPSVCRVDDGVPLASHCNRSLGNAVVPDIPERIGQAIIHIEGARP